VNRDARRAVAVDLPAEAGAPSRILRLGADGLPARDVRLGGALLEALPDGSPPPIPTVEPPAGDGSVTLPPLSVAFVLFPRAAAAACAVNPKG